MSWNCRGAASREFLVEVKEIMREFYPQILIIVEPRISGATANKVCKSLGKKRWIRAGAKGFSEGIWVMCEEGVIEVKLEVANRYFLNMEIQ